METCWQMSDILETMSEKWLFCLKNVRIFIYRKLISLYIEIKRKTHQLWPHQTSPWSNIKEYQLWKRCTCHNFTGFLLNSAHPSITSLLMFWVVIWIYRHGVSPYLKEGSFFWKKLKERPWKFPKIKEDVEFSGRSWKLLFKIVAEYVSRNMTNIEIMQLDPEKI